MTTTAHHEAFSQLLGPAAKVERLATGFTFTEGPVWMPDGSLHFSDMPGDKRRRWHPDDGVSVLRDPSNKGNGMTLEDDHALIVCEHATSRVVRERADGTVEAVATHWAGRELNSPNDVIVAGDGAILFTDPTYGRMPGFGVERPVEQEVRGVYRVPAGGGPLELLFDDFAQPNGLCLSPDESRLYVNDTERAHVRVFERRADGGYGNGRVFADGISATDARDDNLVDGMKVDERGNVYVSGPGGIWVLAADGTRLGTIEVPETVANFNWGGADWRTLYITATSSLYRVRLEVAGNRLGYMR
jgi:gluconolactonase